MTFRASSSWYVVHTQAHAESKAVEHLARQGFATYLPRYRKRRRHARRVEIVAAPLFPRYIFVVIDMATQRWRSIQSTIGVSQLVCSGDSPAVLGNDVIDSLRQSEDECGFVRLDQRPALNRGDRVHVHEGVFSPCIGVFEAATDRDRVAILLDMLGRKVRVVLDRDSVALA